MIKEIFEQPQGLRDTVLPRVLLEEAAVKLEDIHIATDDLRTLRRINIVASGTSRHAGMVGQYMIQELVNLPVDVDYASEFEYRNSLLGPDEITIVITQSGETADTSSAQREAKTRGSHTIAISNVVGSTIAREADGVMYTHAGTGSQHRFYQGVYRANGRVVFFSIYLGQVRGKLGKDERRHFLRELLEIPDKLNTVLNCAEHCEHLAQTYLKFDDFLFMGRAVHYPVAMDGALKLKEVSYVHAEGYPTGETKHGPLALIDEKLPVVIIATCDRSDPGSVIRYEKNIANIKSFKQQSGTSDCDWIRRGHCVA